MDETKRLDRRRVMAGTAGAAALLASPALVRAQGWPNRNIRIVVAFPAGGAADIVARLVGDRLSQIWSQPVVVENRPGAGGNLAGAEVARSDPDGYTYLITSSSAAVNKLLYERMPYDPFTDLAPVSMAISVPNVMVVPAGSQDRSIKGFIDRAKAEPGKLNFGSAGIGTSIHLAGELFKHLAGINITHVPYRGAGPAMNDLMAGRLDVMFDTLTVSAPQLRASTIRALGVTTKEPLTSLSGVPPVASVVPGYQVLSWFAFYAAARTPPEVVAKASADMAQAVKHESVVARLNDLGATAVGSTPQALAAAMQSEAKLWEPVVKAANIRISQ